MTALIVILAILAVFWLISLIRLGGRLRYGEAGFFVTVFVGPYRVQPFHAAEQRQQGEEPGPFFLTLNIGPFRLRLFPAAKKGPEKPKKKEEPKPAKHRKKEEAKPDEPQKPKKPKPEGQPGTLARLMSLLPTVIEAVRTLRRRIRIDDFDLTLIWGGSDPASIAIGYGQANAALGVIWPLVEHNFTVKRQNLDIAMDYGRTELAVELTAAFTITVGQILSLAVWYGLKLLILWVRSGKPKKY